MSQQDGVDLGTELAARRSGSSRASKFTLALVVALVAVAAFGGGVFFQRSTGAAATTSSTAGGPAGPGSGDGDGDGDGGGGGGGFVSGEITKVSGTTLTVTQPDGSQVEVTTTDSTDVTVSSDGSLSDLKPGDSIVVQGEQGTNGSVAATSVTEGLTGGGPRGDGGPRPSR